MTVSKALFYRETLGEPLSKFKFHVEFDAICDLEEKLRFSIMECDLNVPRECLVELVKFFGDYRSTLYRDYHNGLEK